MELHPPQWHDSLTSTNSVLLDWIKEGKEIPDGFVLAAREQTAGRGRGDRSWDAGAGKNLTFSFVLTDDASPQRLVSIPMTVALSVAECLDGYGLVPNVKWPNDVLSDGKKLCGILTEKTGDRVVVGIGINVNMSEEEAAAIDRPATSLMIETAQPHYVETIFATLQPHLERRVEDWETDGFAAIAADWSARCHKLYEEIEVGDGDNKQTGILAGFGDFGQLILRLPDDTETEVWAGDVGF